MKNQVYGDPTSIVRGYEIHWYGTKSSWLSIERLPTYYEKSFKPQLAHLRRPMGGIIVPGALASRII